MQTAVIPGGCTKFIQAPDVSWNGPLKARFRKDYDRWMSNDSQKEFTSGGNPKAPSMDVYLQWIVDAWDSLSPEAIAKSFKDCGITICFDGSEDDKVHCFKPHGPIPEGRAVLMDARYSIKEMTVVEEVDAEQDEENGYMSDESLELDWSDELNAPNPHFHAF